jgi:hypothetical protein
MIRMQNAVNPATRRIGQLIRMLSSDQPAEAAAAAQALNRTLASAGLVIHAPLMPLSGDCSCRQWSSRPGGRSLRPPRLRPAVRMADPCKWASALSAISSAASFTRAAAAMMPGVGQHVAQLVCDDCGNGGRWLGH